MGVGVGHWLRAVAFLSILGLSLVAFACTQPIRAEARANLTSYLSTSPGNWEPMGFNASGTAPWYIVQSLGYNATKIVGNLGIGNGSVQTINATSNFDGNYTVSNIMAADISLAPWDPGRLENARGPGNASKAKSVPSAGGTGATKAKGLAGNETGGKAGSLAGSRGARNVSLNDPYHSILMGRPVDDLLYEYPVEPPGNMYGRLLGLGMPDGTVANMGVKCAGYGF